jgi:hypothetical protein
MTSITHAAFNGPRLFLRTLIGVAALALLAGSPLRGQSTGSLERPERPVMIEVGGGLQLLNFGWSDAAIGRVGAGIVAARWRPPGAAAGLRASALWIQRSDATRWDSRSSTGVTHRILGLAVSGDVQRRLGSGLTIAPSLGIGLAPSVYSSDEPRWDPSDTGKAPTSGTLWTLGVALRASRVVVEQHFIGLLGADRTIPYGREYFPLTLSIRF